MAALQITMEKLLINSIQPEMKTIRFVHQLDFATSGVLLVGLIKSSTANACRAFENGSAKKSYLAILEGHIKRNMTINEPIGGY